MAAYTGSHSAPKHAKEKIGPSGKSKVPSRRHDTSEDFTAPDLKTDYYESADIYSDGNLRRVRSDVGKPRHAFKEKITHIILVIAAFFVAGAVGAAGVLMLFSQGPSQQLTKQFVRSFNNTRTMKWVPEIFMSEQEISESLDATADTTYLQYGYERESVISEVIFEAPDKNEETIELIDVAGANWIGKMYIVRDPSLIRLATPDPKSNGSYGNFMLISEYCDKYGAIGGITAGGFDVKVGAPYGFVIIDGKIASPSGEAGEYVGITADHRLITDWGTAQDALDSGVVEGCVWGPVLVRAGIKFTGLGGGFSARSAIGQCADGTFLLLVVEGRSLRSLGASYQDIADFLYSQGCINAINLDSGRSAVLVHNGENVTNIAIGAGIASEERKLPNAFVVLPEGANG